MTEDSALHPFRYASSSCGVSLNNKGSLLFISDVLAALEYINDDDELVRQRLVEFAENLQSDIT